MGEGSIVQVLQKKVGLCIQFLITWFYAGKRVLSMTVPRHRQHFDLKVDYQAVPESKSTFTSQIESPQHQNDV